MEENKEIEVKLERHLWPDEVEALEKKKKRKTKVVLLFVLIIALLAGSLGLGIYLGKKSSEVTIYVPNNSNTSSRKFSRLESIYNTLLNKWYFADQLENAEDELIDRAIAGMIGEDIDPHTVYMDKDEVLSFTQSIDMGFVGIGVSYELTDTYVLVKSVFYQSPADNAGIKPGDMIIEVDHEKIAGWTSDEVKERIMGEEGTTVNITCERGGETFNVDIIRGTVENSVFGEIRDDYGYIEIYQFSTAAPEQIEKLLQLFKENNINKLILDVRDDGGGYLSSLIGVADLFLDEGQIILTQKYSDEDDVISVADGKHQYVFDKIIILGNNNSASASEALIAALCENNKAEFVGIQTYGKSTIQVPSYYSDGSALKYTHGMWFTPLGNVINRVGITPDYEVKLHRVLTDSYLLMKEDEQVAFDMVDNKVIMVQDSLDFLGYEVDRFDGYFSRKTEDAVKAFEKDNNLVVDGIVDYEEYEYIYQTVSRVYSVDTDKYDTQLQKAIELLHE